MFLLIYRKAVLIIKKIEIRRIKMDNNQNNNKNPKNNKQNWSIIIITTLVTVFLVL